MAVFTEKIDNIFVKDNRIEDIRHFGYKENSLARLPFSFITFFFTVFFPFMFSILIYEFYDQLASKSAFWQVAGVNLLLYFLPIFYVLSSIKNKNKFIFKIKNDTVFFDTGETISLEKVEKIICFQQKICHKRHKNSINKHYFTMCNGCFQIQENEKEKFIVFNIEVGIFRTESISREIALSLNKEYKKIDFKNTYSYIGSYRPGQGFEHN